MPPTVPRVRPALLAAHRWIGVGLGLLIILQGLTGAVTAFRRELDRLVDPAAFVVAPGHPKAPLAAVVQAARAAAPGARLDRIDYPDQPDDAYLAHLEGPRGAMLATLDPASAKVLRVGGLAAWPVELIYHLHYSFAAGETGERVIGAAGLGVFFMALTGPLVWWPGRGRLRQALSVTTTAGPWRAARDLHRLVGVCACLLLGVIAFTGVNMAWKPWIRPLVAAVAPLRPPIAAKPDLPRCKAPRPLDAAVAAAQAREGGESLRNLRFQGRSGRLVAVYLASRQARRPQAVDQVRVDACSSQILDVREAAGETAGDGFYAWLLPIHSGQWLGLVGRLLDAAAALALAGLGVAGYWLWITRRRRTRVRQGT